MTRVKSYHLWWRHRVSFCKGATEGPGGRELEGTSVGVMEEVNRKKTEDGNMAVGTVVAERWVPG